MPEFARFFVVFSGICQEIGRAKSPSILPVRVAEWEIFASGGGTGIPAESGGCETGVQLCSMNQIYT
jgi:hypothetical protein